MTPTFLTSPHASAAEAANAPGPHLILVGLPGCGKSTIGRAVAERTGRPFLDVDREIERREGKSVSRIFADSGEAYFRAKERELTEELAACGGLIVAPGGGWAVRQEVVALVRPPSRLVYLKVSAREALARLGAAREARPLLARPDPLAELERLLAARRAAYEASDCVVEAELHDRQRVIDEVTALASPGLAT